jgi:hypothetical protein
MGRAILALRTRKDCYNLKEQITRFTLSTQLAIIVAVPGGLAISEESDAFG